MTREWEKLFAKVHPWSTADSAGNLRGAMGMLAEGGDAMALVDEKGKPRAVLSCGVTPGGYATAFSPAVGGRPDESFVMNTNFQNGSELGITLLASGVLEVQVRGKHGTAVLRLAPDLAPLGGPDEPSIEVVRDSVVASLPKSGWLRLLPASDEGQPLSWQA